MLKEEQHKKEHTQTEKSKYNSSETCDGCHGSGMIDGNTCSSCNGTGVI